MKYAILAFFLGVSATAATFYRYGSLDPCVWLKRDMAAESSLPVLAVQAQITLKLGLNPTTYECLEAWWEFRTDGLPTEG